MKTELIHLVYTRISHDLSGVAGALFNGSELLLEFSGQVQDTALLMNSSAKVLIARLKFFRQAFGMNNAWGDDATEAYLKTLSEPVRLYGVCTNALMRVLSMVLADTLIYGGEIKIEDGKLIATSETIKKNSKLKNVLCNGEKTDQAPLAPALYAFYLAKEQGLQLEIQEKNKSLSILVKKMRRCDEKGYCC